MPYYFYPPIKDPADLKPKMKKKNTAGAPGKIPFETFQSLDLRTGKVLAAERIPETDKLLKLTVDIGEERTLVAGIGKAYAPEALVGRTVIVVANLKPTKIRGVRSEGMVLAAGGDSGLTLLTVSEPAEPGEKVK
jgi:methionyl-tRNA synthetase